MPRGLIERPIRLLVNGSLDTKSNPKLVQPGALLELTNMYQLRTGEMRPRNGYAAFVMATGITSAENLIVSKGGGLATITRGFGSVATPRYARFSQAALTGNVWALDVSGESGSHTVPFPAVTAAVKNVEPNLMKTATSTDSIDPDVCLSGGYYLAVWTDGVSQDVYNDFRELTTGTTKSGLFNALLTAGSDTGRPPRVAGNGTWTAYVVAKAGTISARGYNLGVQTSSINLGVDISAASPWFDVKQIPGSNNFAVAYNVTGGGGVKCGIFNPSAGTFTSTVTTAAADPSFCLGWLSDALGTGNMYLVTAGSTAGVVVRTMSATTMVVSATNVIDATATTGIRNVTGNIRTNATNYVVFWDVAGSSSIYDQIKIGRWNGAASVATLAANHSIYSRSFQLSDSTYYLMACNSSTVQGTYSVFATEPIASTMVSARAPVVCAALAGEASGRRLQCSLATPVTNGTSVIVPVSRSRKVTTPTGTAPQAKSICLLTVDRTTKITRARELGGSVFIPGGVLQVDDGVATQDACFPFYPEVPTATTAAGGSMTASGAYLYRIVFSALDADSRVVRSAGSVPLSVTLGAGDGTANLAIPRPRVPRGLKSTDFTTLMFGGMFAEVYRRGPAASGASLYNKVGQANVDAASTDTIAFADTMSDANAALGEVAYFNGNVLENFNPPSHSLLEVNGNRVGIVNAEDTTEFWYSKEYKPGAGIGFNPLLKVTISGDGAGGMTALAAMDGRWVLFKRAAIYVLSGDGANDLGQGSFNAPQAVTRTLGTINPSSVIETPDGIMFQAVSGDFWLLDRGLGMSYIGAPVEGLTDLSVTGNTVVGAALVPSLSIVRFVLRDGLSLEWDYYHKRWYEHQLRVDSSEVVDCANSSQFGWCYLLADGTLLKDTIGQTADVSGTTTAIIPRVSFPHIQLAGLAGYQRLKYIDFTVDVLGSCTLSVDAEYDMSGTPTGTPKTIAVTTGTPTIQFQYTPPEGKAKCTSVRPIITVAGNPTNGTFRLTGATAVIGVKRGSTATASDRMT